MIRCLGERQRCEPPQTDCKEGSGGFLYVGCTVRVSARKKRSIVDAPLQMRGERIQIYEKLLQFLSI